MRSAAGFTLIELVAVLVIVAALAVFVAPRLNVAGFSQYSFHQELLAAMRHAQKTANASSCEVAVNVDASNDSYSVSFTGDGNGACSATSLAKPGGSGDLSGSAPDGVDITNGASFTLNSFGVPSSNNRIEIALGGGGRRVFVEANTGYVHDDA